MSMSSQVVCLSGQFERSSHLGILAGGAVVALRAIAAPRVVVARAAAGALRWVLPEEPQKCALPHLLRSRQKKPGGDLD